MSSRHAGQVTGVSAAGSVPGRAAAPAAVKTDSLSPSATASANATYFKVLQSLEGPAGRGQRKMERADSATVQIQVKQDHG